MSDVQTDIEASSTGPEEECGQEHPPVSSGRMVRWLGVALILETLFAGLMLYRLLHI